MNLCRNITASLLWIMSCLLASVFLTLLQYYLFFLGWMLYRSSGGESDENL
jgi:hypothetical protein